MKDLTLKDINPLAVNALSDVILIYTDETYTRQYRQPLADITDAGTLTDPDTGDDLKLIGWVLNSKDLGVITLRNEANDHIREIEPKEAYRFGSAALRTLAGPEPWSADTLQELGDIAAAQLNLDFDEFLAE